MVSPGDKNGGDVTGDGQMVVASKSGNAVAYASRASFADTSGTGGAGQTQYVARRGTGGWSTHAITPRPAPVAVQLFAGSTQIPTFSDELETAILWAYDLPDVAGDPPDTVDGYREITATRALVPVTVSQVDPLVPGDFSGAFWGASDDTRHVSLVFRRRLLPDAPGGNVPTVYEWADGTLRIASVLPDGSIPADGADVQPKFYRRTVTPDGSRVLFVSPPTGDSQLYMRVDGTHTVWISQPENSDVTGSPADVMLQAVSGDGRHILFTTSSPLLRDDNNFGSDLYLYTDSADPSSDGNLTLISRDGASSGGIDGSDDGGAVIGTSDDASRIYFDDVNGNVYLWDQGSITQVSNELPRGYSRGRGVLLSATDSVPGASRVSPDGRNLAFLANATRGSDQVHGLTGQITNGHLAMYVYSADQNALTCCSCPRNAAVTSDATVVPAATVATASSGLTGARPRYLAADGRVFFSTADALVPEDVNGVVDTYQCDAQTGEVSLVSTGRDANGAWFVDASVSGDDVFFVTRARLVGTDNDNLVDLYDARVGGGFSEPAPAPRACLGEECQGDLPAPLGDLGIGTEAFSDEGGALGTHTGSHVRLVGAHTFVGASARIAVHLSARGRLSWVGAGIRRGTRSISKTGTVRLRVALTRGARAQLLRRGTYRSKLTLRFAAVQGGRSTTTVRLAFKTTKGAVTR
jgi:WD40-like Beta Propeller Repeat